MKTSLDENAINNSKGNNIINFISKDLNKPPLSNILSDSNIELNLDEYKNKDLRCLTCYLIPKSDIRTIRNGLVLGNDKNKYKVYQYQQVKI